MSYVLLGLLSFGQGLVYFWVGCLTFSLSLFLIVARVLFICGLAGLHMAEVLSTLGLVALFNIGLL